MIGLAEKLGFRVQPGEDEGLMRADLELTEAVVAGSRRS